MIVKGNDLVRAYMELANANPVPAEEVIRGDDTFRALMGGTLLYELTEESCDELLPLLRTRYKAEFEYNGGEYQFDGAILDCGKLTQAEGGEKHIYIYPTGSNLDFLQGLARVKNIVEFIAMEENERWSKARESNQE